MLNAIFQKTDKGRDELATRRHKLGVRHRQALILLDGEAPASILLKVFGDAPTVLRVVEELSVEGFIARQSGRAPAPAADVRKSVPVTPTAPVWAPTPARAAAPTAARAVGSVPVAPKTQPAPPVATEAIAISNVPPAVPSAVDRAKMESARIIMLDTTDRCLGLMGADLKQRIAEAGDSVALRAIIPRWHMALRESRKGHQDAQRYLDTVVIALEN